MQRALSIVSEGLLSPFFRSVGEQLTFTRPLRLRGKRFYLSPTFLRLSSVTSVLNLLTYSERVAASPHHWTPHPFPAKVQFRNSRNLIAAGASPCKPQP